MTINKVSSLSTIFNPYVVIKNAKSSIIKISQTVSNLFKAIFNYFRYYFTANKAFQSNKKIEIIDTDKEANSKEKIDTKNDQNRSLFTWKKAAIYATAALITVGLATVGCYYFTNIDNANDAKPCMPGDKPVAIDTSYGPYMTKEAVSQSFENISKKFSEGLRNSESTDVSLQYNWKERLFSMFTNSKDRNSSENIINYTIEDLSQAEKTCEKTNESIFQKEDFCSLENVTKSSDYDLDSARLSKTYPEFNNFRLLNSLKEIVFSVVSKAKPKPISDALKKEYCLSNISDKNILALKHSMTPSNKPVTSITGPAGAYKLYYNSDDTVDKYAKGIDSIISGLNRGFWSLWRYSGERLDSAKAIADSIKQSAPENIQNSLRWLFLKDRKNTYNIPSQEYIAEDLMPIGTYTKYKNDNDTKDIIYESFKMLSKGAESLTNVSADMLTSTIEAAKSIYHTTSNYCLKELPLNLKWYTHSAEGLAESVSQVLASTSADIETTLEEKISPKVVQSLKQSAEPAISFSQISKFVTSIPSCFWNFYPNRIDNATAQECYDSDLTTKNVVPLVKKVFINNEQPQVPTKVAKGAGFWQSLENSAKPAVSIDDVWNYIHNLISR